MKSSIDLGLAISAHHSTLGVPRTSDSIAAYCGCSRQRIEQIEKRALRKVRARLYQNPELNEELRERFNK
jgi:DNA-directed RNA polymerase sigma subunit (sigma70/sigma32)